MKMPSKILVLLLSISLFTNVNAQFEYDDIAIEARMHQDFTDSRQADCYCNLAGTYNAVTTTPNWCGDTWTGTVIFEMTDLETYDVYTINDDGDQVKDFTMGAYYACFGLNATTAAGSLALVNDCGLSYTGITQWGEVWTVEQFSFSGDELSITWDSDYDPESGTTVLTRTDGMVWEDFACEQCVVSESDSMALVDLYNAAGGADWETKWDLNEPVRDWHGITLNLDCKITEIILSLDELGNFGNNLAGTLPASIANISSLEVLDVANNEGMTGSIPMEYGNFENLRYLRLFNCSFSGDIPQSLANVSTMDNFSLGLNDFTGSLNKDILELPNLRAFQCPSCLLEGNIPSDVNASENLEILSVSGNMLTGEIPLWIGDVPNMTFLYLGRNQLTGSIPNNITNFSGWGLDLSYNKLSGLIPVGWEGSSMSFLMLNNNEFEGDLPSDFHTINTTRIQLQSNKLTGPIPTNLLDDGQFGSIYLHDNNFDGCISDIDTLCLQTLQTIPSDTVIVRDVPYYYYFHNGYSLMNNPKLPWSGDLTEYCMGTDQVGAPCDDGIFNTAGDSITVDCECAGVLTSVNELTSVSDLSIFPNPAAATSELTISFDALYNEDLQLSVIDILGREMSLQNHKVASGSNQLQIRNQNLTPGIYYLRISNQEKSISKSFYIY